ncbi:MAG: Rrf2 family transcriptional regulator [Proteobacteria bacterium]|nr:Rrf2 family transcriptional regulator [Pseudomonadota bacterium]
MRSLLRISDAASLAIHAAALLASAKEPIRVSVLASILEASDAHLSKVMQRLARAKVVNSVRGRHGGFVLRQKPEEISVLDVWEAIDGPLGKPGCLLDHPHCPAAATCPMHGLEGVLHRKVRDTLATTLLSDIDLSKLLTQSS